MNATAGGAPNLTFNLRHTTREVTCAEAGHNLADGAECQFVHTALTGDATLTLAGPADVVRRAAATVFPDLAKVLDPPSEQAPPPAPVNPSHDWTWVTGSTAKCLNCGIAVNESGRVTTAGAAPCPGAPKSDDASGQESAYLTADDLAAMPVGATVTALGPTVADREHGHRCRWSKGAGAAGYWFPDGCANGVTGALLAEHRQPMLDT